MKPEISSPFTIERLKKNRKLRLTLYRIGGVDPWKYSDGSGRFSIFDGFGTIGVGSNFPDVHDAKQGGYMDRIRFDKWDKVTQKGYAMIEVDGTYVGGDKDGEPFKTRVFSSQKHLIGPVKDANAGDILAITFKQNGKFRNAIKIVNETADGHPAPENTGTADAHASNSTLVSQPIISAAASNPKHEAATLATQFYIKAREAKIKPDDIPEAFVEALRMADMVQDWREGKGAFAMGLNEGLPSEEEMEDVPD